LTKAITKVFTFVKKKTVIPQVTHRSKGINASKLHVIKDKFGLRPTRLGYAAKANRSIHPVVDLAFIPGRAGKGSILHPNGAIT